MPRTYTLEFLRLIPTEKGRKKTFNPKSEMRKTLHTFSGIRHVRSFWWLVSSYLLLAMSLPSADTKEKPSISVIGDAFVDILASGVQKLPSWGKDCYADSLSLHPGGSAGNVASNLARLSIPTTYYTTIGEDRFGKIFRDAMAARGVRCSFTLDPSRPTPSCVVLSSVKSGDRCFINSIGTNNAVSAAGFLEQKEAIARATHTHIGGYFNCPQLQAPELVSLIRYLQKEGRTVSMDAQTDSIGEWKGRDGNLVEVMAAVDYLFPSEVEACAMSGCTTVSEAAKWFSKYMKPEALLVIKCGENGAMAFQEGKLLHHQASYQVEVVDATGAGDAFDAAFLAGVVSGKPLEEAMAMGCGAGAMRVTLISGSDRAPTPQQLEAFTNSHKLRAAKSASALAPTIDRPPKPLLSKL